MHACGLPFPLHCLLFSSLYFPHSTSIFHANLRCEAPLSSQQDGILEQDLASHMDLYRRLL